MASGRALRRAHLTQQQALNTSKNNQDASSRGSKQRSSTEVGDQEPERAKFAYKVLTCEQTQELMLMTDVDELHQKMAEMMSIADSDIDLKAGATLDYYVSSFWWGKEQSYTIEQLSSFLTVAHTLLENVRDNQQTLVDALREFRKMFSGVARPAVPNPQAEQQPPSTQTDTVLNDCTNIPAIESSVLLDCFTTTQAKAIIDYMHTSLFQHYRLYEFMFGHTQAEEIIGTDLDIDIPREINQPWPPPLEEALLEELHLTALAADVAADEEAEPAEEMKADGVIEELDTQKVKDLLGLLSPVEVMAIINGVLDEMLDGLKEEVAAKLREKENHFINRINKIRPVTSETANKLPAEQAK